MKFSRIRFLIPLLFVVAAVVSIAVHGGFGTLSSFGYESIALICPLGTLESMAASASFIPKAVIAFLVFAAICVLFGRIFCGWICPVSLLRKITGSEPKTPLKEGDGKKGSLFAPFAILFGAVASAFAFGFPVFCLICPVGLTFALIIGVWGLFAFNDPSWTLLLTAAVLFAEVTILRRWCSKFCPLGALITLLSLLNKTWKPKVAPSCLKQSDGVGCNRCREACPEGIDLNAPITALLSARCTKCRQCADACPTSSIRFPVVALKMKTEEEALKPKAEIIERDPSERIKDYSEITLPMNRKTAQAEAERCLSCRLCEQACPQHNPIAEIIEAVREETPSEMRRLLMKPGMLPEICARVCPQERLCESVCPLSDKGGAVSIGALMQYSADYVLKHPRATKGAKAKKKHLRAAIIGAGPGGLSAAHVLASEGVETTVYDAHSEIGGLLTYGIPAFKLDKSLIAARRKLYEKTGIRFELSVKVEGEEDFRKITDNVDVCLIATGAQVPVMPDIPGVPEGAMIPSSVYLEHSYEASVHTESARDLSGKSVVVLGGGDSAMDCARTAIRQGAARVYCAARKPVEEWRASKSEMRHAREEGVVFVGGVQPIDAVVKDCKLRALNMQSSDVAVISLDADLLVVAWGFRAVRQQWLPLSVRTDEKGRIVTDKTYKAADGIYAVGDAVSGPALVTDAIAEARAAASAILAEFTSAKA